jgi:hypothetical protein
MANLNSEVSNKDKPKAGGTTNKKAGTEDSKEEERDEHDGVKVCTACGGEHVKPKV